MPSPCADYGTAEGFLSRSAIAVADCCFNPSLFAWLIVQERNRVLKKNSVSKHMVLLEMGFQMGSEAAPPTGISEHHVKQTKTLQLCNYRRPG